MNTRFMFLRDRKRHPVGCIAFQVNRTNNTISYQLSVLNPVDDFKRKLARHLALGRMVETPITLSLSNPMDGMHEITMCIMKDILASNAASRAVKAARLWLSKTPVNPKKTLPPLKDCGPDWHNVLLKM